MLGSIIVMRPLNGKICIEVNMVHDNTEGNLS